MAYDQMLDPANEAGGALIQNGGRRVGGPDPHDRARGRRRWRLNVIAFEGSDSLDDPRRRVSNRRKTGVRSISGRRAPGGVPAPFGTLRQGRTLSDNPLARRVRGERSLNSALRPTAYTRRPNSKSDRHEGRSMGDKIPSPCIDVCKFKRRRSLHRLLDDEAAEERSSKSSTARKRSAAFCRDLHTNSSRNWGRYRHWEVAYRRKCDEKERRRFRLE